MKKIVSGKSYCLEGCFRYQVVGSLLRGWHLSSSVKVRKEPVMWKCRVTEFLWQRKQQVKRSSSGNGLGMFKEEQECHWLKINVKWSILNSFFAFSDLQETLEQTPRGYLTSFEMFNSTYKLYTHRWGGGQGGIIMFYVVWFCQLSKCFPIYYCIWPALQSLCQSLKA